jgi:AP-4 complex subunit beta-1
MCTNTLQKDCGNQDPMVRGLALRALCGLNLPIMVEYIREPLRRGLADAHAYVRKTAVMGVLKLYDLDAAAFESFGFVDVLYDMLRDPDASVVCNCIIVLNEVMEKSLNGGMAINRAIMLHLLNRIHEFNEFAKVQVLELVPRYIPANDEEGFQIMNLLDPVLRTSGSAAVMATMRAFLSIAEHVDDAGSGDMKRQIVGRVKAPLVTQISSGTSEMMYTLLKHVNALCDMCPGVFDDEYRQFYVRYNEPTHVKFIKIDILSKLANHETAPDIVAELAELVADKNTKMSRLAVRSMARIACSLHNVPGAAESIARRLVEMLDLNIEHVSSEAATALASIVRKHPSSKTLVSPPLVRSLKYLAEPSGKASIVFLLGECGDLVTEAPYALEKLIDSYDDITDVGVKLALLGSTVKLFFARPPEVQRMLGRLLAKATDDVSSQDLHDRALLYYRLLRSGADPKSIEKVARTNTLISEVGPFSEDDDSELRAWLMDEFNTLSIIYGKPSINFIHPEYQTVYKKQPDEHPLAPGDTGIMNSAEIGQTNQPVAAAAVLAPLVMNDDVDLLGFGGSPSPVAATTYLSPTAGVTLSATAVMSSDDFQSHWISISDNESVVSTVPMSRLPMNTDEVEAKLVTRNIMTMASGELPTEFKFFLYAQDSSSGNLFLIQANLEKTAEPLLIVTVKASGGTEGSRLIESLVEIMASALN